MKHCLISFLLLYLSLFSITASSQWIKQTNGLQQSWNHGNAIGACNNNTALISVDNIVYKTEDSGGSWQKISFSFPDDGTDVSIIDINHFWITTATGKIFATSNGGKSWILQFYDTTKTRFMNHIKMFDLNNGVAIGDAVENNPILFLSTTDGGTNWISINNTVFDGGFSGDVWRRISFIDKNNGYIYVSGISGQQFFKTTNGGKNWLSTNYPNTFGELIKFYNDNLGLAVYMQQAIPNLKLGICRTKDGGNSWETFDLNSTSYPADIEFVPGNPSKVWYVNLGSLYFSTDTGRTWTENKIYNGNLLGRDLVFTDSTHGWLLCDSGKVFYTSNNGGIVSSISLNKIQFPSEYLLKQNYPNPFNPTTQIVYNLKEIGYVTLIVYDILGDEVEKLIDGVQNAGEHSVNFNGGNLSSGIYIYKLTGNNFSLSKKMLLLK